MSIAELAELWGGQLGSPASEFDPATDFFDAGGNSLRLVHLKLQIQRVWGVNIPLRSLLESSRLGDMWLLIDGLLKSSCVIAGSDEKIPHPSTALNHLRPSLVQRHRLQIIRHTTPGGSTSSAIGIFARLSGPVDFHSLFNAYERTISRQPYLRMTFPELDLGNIHLLPSAQAAGDFEYIDLGVTGCEPEASHRRAESVAVNIVSQPFDHRNGPLVRGRLIRADDSLFFLVFAFEHLIFDGASVDVFFNELSVLYDEADDESPLLDRAKVNGLVAGFLEREERAWSDEGSDGAKAYWAHKLAKFGLQPRLALKEAKYGSGTLTLNPTVGEHPFPIPALSERHSHLQGRGWSPFIIGLSALLASASSFDFVNAIGAVVPSSNRDFDGGDRLVGFFAVSMNVCIDIAESDLLTDVVAKTASDFLGALKHSVVPMGSVVASQKRALNSDFIKYPWVFCDYIDNSSNDFFLGSTKINFLQIPASSYPKTHPSVNASIIRYGDGSHGLKLYYAMDAFAPGQVVSFYRRAALFLHLLSHDSSVTYGDYVNRVSLELPDVV